MVGPEWPCMFVTFAFIIVPSVFFFKNVAINLHPAVVVFGVLTLLATLISFTFTACSDPGIIYESVPEDQDIENKEDMIECGRCNIKRPITSSHCGDCNLCIDELDHHCPWTGKCIGKKNIKYFFTFSSADIFRFISDNYSIPNILLAN